MHLLVLIKQVTEPETVFDLNDGRAAPRAEPRYKLNSYDEFALEAALQIREAHPGSTLTALTIGPPRTEAALQRAVGLGFDRAVRLETGDSVDPDPALLAALAAQWAAGQGFDLILAGALAEDDRQGVVGAMLAQRLNLPLAGSVVELKPEPDRGRLIVHRELEGGRRQVMELPLPTVATVQSGLNEPRYPTLSNMLRAKKTPPEVVEMTLPEPPPQARSIGLARPERSRVGRVLEGDTAAKAAELVDLLRKRALL